MTLSKQTKNLSEKWLILIELYKLRLIEKAEAGTDFSFDSLATLFPLENRSSNGTEYLISNSNELFCQPYYLVP